MVRVGFESNLYDERVFAHRMLDLIWLDGWNTVNRSRIEDDRRPDEVSHGHLGIRKSRPCTRVDGL
jgi:hypothetical protein